MSRTAWYPGSSSSGFESSKLYELWEKRVKKGDDNDLVITIAPSSKSGISGVGKTTLALTLARKFDITDAGFDAEEKATMKNSDITEMYEKCDKGASVIWDEAQGTKESSGVDSRRGMAQDNLDAIRDIALNRNESITLIMITQSASWLDRRIMQLIDSLLLIERKGAARHFQYYLNDLDFGGANEYTPCMEHIHWDKISKKDPDYKEMERMKEEAKRKAQDEEEAKDPEEVKREQKRKIAQRMRNNGTSQNEIAESVGMSQGWVSENTNKPREVKAQT